jgi:hypothetical protein
MKIIKLLRVPSNVRRVRRSVTPPHILWVDLLHVLAYQLGELEHRNGWFPAEDGLQRRIRIDLAFVLGVLQAVGFDVLVLSSY